MIESIVNRVVRGPFASGNHLRFARLDGTEVVPLEQVVRDADRLAHALRRRGIGAGARIGIRARNGYEWVLLDLAALRLHAVTAGFEPGKFGDDDDLVERYDLTVLFDEGDHGGPRVQPIGEVRALLTEAADDAEVLFFPFAPDEPTTIKFSSGTTGTPKGLGAWAGSIDSSIAAVQHAFAHGPGDDLFLFLPLSLLQQRYWIYSALCFGHDVTVSTYEAALPLLRLRARAGAGPTVIMGVPGFYETALTFIEATAGAGADDDARRAAARGLFGERIRYLWTGSAPARPALVQAFHDLGMPMYEGYGLNETCIVAKNSPGAFRPGSVGRLLPGKRVSFDEDGVISVHCDYPVNAQYDYAAPGESERVFGPDGVVRTGDVGHVDADGFLYVHGRADDVIVLDNGKKVDVRPIEERLRAHPAIAEAVVFCPTASTLAVIVSPADAAADLTAIEAHVAAANAELAHDEQLGRVVVARTPFTVANGLLTSQFKPRRRAIIATFAGQAEAVATP